LGVQFLHWFNPLAWWTLQRFRADRELVCDAMVVASIEPGEQHSYCKVLVKIAEILWPGPEMFSTALSVVSSTSELKRRIIMIKSYQKPGITARVMTAALSVLLAGFTLTRARQTDHAANSHPLAPTSLALSIDAKGDIRLSDEKNVLTIDELRAVLRSNAVSNSELVLHLKADRNAPFDRVIKVVDTARDFQIAGISLATQSGPPERSGDSSNVVSKIDIKYVGPHLAEESQVRANIHVRLGDPFGPAAIDDDVRRLYGTGLFHDVRVAKKVEPEGTSLTYVVQCNPHISEISFSGNSSFSEAELSKLITARVNSPLRERVLFSDAEVIRDVYEKAGFNETVVKYSYELNAESALAKVTFRITENK
jgi:biopolymer transport protein ExbD